MNNLLSYCGLIDAKIRASDKDLPVPIYLSGTIRTLLRSKTFRFDSNCGCVQDGVSDGFLLGTRLVYIVALDALKIL